MSKSKGHKIKKSKYYKKYTIRIIMKKQNKSKLKEIALERIHILFKEAKLNSSKANRYVQLARRIAMKVNLPIPKEYKRKYCKHCNNYFNTKNCRVRTRNKMLIYYCLNCKKYTKLKITKTI